MKCDSVSSIAQSMGQIVIFVLMAFAISEYSDSEYSLTHFSRTEFASLIKWTSPLSFNGLLGGTEHCVFIISTQILIEYSVYFY